MSSASKKSHGLGDDCYVLCRTDNGKSVLLPFKEGPGLHVDNLFFDKYPVRELGTGGKEILFWPDWDSNVNDPSIDPRVYVEILDHLVLPRDIMFASQISSLELMKYFSTALI